MTELETVLAELLARIAHDPPDNLECSVCEEYAQDLAPHIERAFIEVGWMYDELNDRPPGDSVHRGTESLREALNDER